ncbi:hypothetical protein BRD56_02705 [Thermoplasmatales archaeon SW_10_69_26]|nr:MAG: hypothetical protein BRD56_02705 [Thermoplasmatales archaeon SW_10_69_26]
MPAGASSVDVTVDDVSDVEQAAYGTFQPADNGPFDDASDTSGEGTWVGTSSTVDVPSSGAAQVRVAVGDPVVGGSEGESVATTGTITADVATA